MGCYFRRTVKLGPINVNLSKRGIGYSVGLPGVRIGKNARGQKYLTASRHHLYYRRLLSARKGRKA